MNRSRWVAIDASTDPRLWARELAQAHSDVLAGAAPPALMREAIISSWDRSAHAGVDPEGGGAPLSSSEDQATARWERHPLSVAEPILRELLADVRSDDDQVVLICDADGTLLWIDGEPAVCDAARAVNLQPGGSWSETAAGTNAMGTALELGHSIQVFSAEHYAQGVHQWTCSAAPIHDPEDGSTLGVIDLSGELGTAHPHSLALIEAAARVVEGRLESLMMQRDAALRERVGERVGGGRGKASALLAASGRVIDTPRREWSELHLEVPSEGGLVELTGGVSAVAEPLPGERGFLLWRAGDVRPRRDETLRLEALGRSRAVARIGFQSWDLTPRHSELIVLLAFHPDGSDAEHLAAELYGREGKSVSVRAGLSRLRKLRGERLPGGGSMVHLAGELKLDYLEVERLAATGRLADALRAYRGKLLPASRVPALVERRERLDHGLREAALREAGTEALTLWLETPSGEDDLVACRELLSRLDPEDPGRPAALSRLRRLAGGA